MSRWKSKQGQSATNAAVTVILIAVLIILYILFLSPEDRADLLDEPYPNGGGGGGGITPGVKNILMSETPGRLYPLGANMIDHTMPSFLVFTETNANELKRTDSLYIKNSAFSDKTEELIFFYDDRSTTDVKLSFNVKDHYGRLIIWLNDYKIVDADIKEASPPPISLPREYLEPKNSMVFEVSSPGAAFWRVNEYQLENILISGRITDYTGAFSEQHFSIGDTEYASLERGVFEFLPDCPPRETGLVQILINNKPIYTGAPDCGVKTMIEVSREFLRLGDNLLVVNTNSGSFLIDMPKVTTYLKESDPPVFYFNIPNALLNAIYYGQNGVGLTLRFVDTTSVKRGDIELNGFKMRFETQDIIFQEFINPEFLVPGPNSIKIVPSSDPIDVAELRIDLI